MDKPLPHMRYIFDKDGFEISSRSYRGDDRSFETIPGLYNNSQHWYRINGAGLTGEQIRAIARKTAELEGLDDD